MISTQVRANKDTAKLDILKRETVSVLDPDSESLTALLVVQADDFSYRYEIELEPDAAKTLIDRLSADWLKGGARCQK